VIEPRIHGELGYGEWSIHLTEMGHCSCDGCGGHLEDGTCISCGCRQGIHEPSRFHRQRFAAWGPMPEAGRCSHADAVRTEEERHPSDDARTWSSSGPDAGSLETKSVPGWAEPS
jgi:hypothetical protein